MKLSKLISVLASVAVAAATFNDAGLAVDRSVDETSSPAANILSTRSECPACDRAFSQCVTDCLNAGYNKNYCLQGCTAALCQQAPQCRDAKCGRQCNKVADIEVTSDFQIKSTFRVRAPETQCPDCDRAFSQCVDECTAAGYPKGYCLPGCTNALCEQAPQCRDAKCGRCGRVAEAETTLETEDEPPLDLESIIASIASAHPSAVPIQRHSTFFRKRFTTIERHSKAVDADADADLYTPTTRDFNSLDKRFTTIQRHTKAVDAAVSNPTPVEPTRTPLKPTPLQRHSTAGDSAAPEVTAYDN